MSTKQLTGRKFDQTQYTPSVLWNERQTTQHDSERARCWCGKDRGAGSVVWITFYHLENPAFEPVTYVVSRKDDSDVLTGVDGIITKGQALRIPLFDCEGLTTENLSDAYCDSDTVSEILSKLPGDLYQAAREATRVVKAADHINESVDTEDVTVCDGKYTLSIWPTPTFAGRLEFVCSSLSSVGICVYLGENEHELDTVYEEKRWIFNSH